jgi:delta24(24(1))-sterol reductase
MVETPGVRRSRRTTPATDSTDAKTTASSIQLPTKEHTNGAPTPLPTKAHTNGAPTASPKRSRDRPKKNPHPEGADASAANGDYKVDSSGVKDFGGPAGVTAMMIGFPTLMYYMWIGATFYDGKFPIPAPGQTMIDFIQHLSNLVYTHAFPHPEAWAIYWGFFIVEGLFYLYMPGVYAEGKPLEHLGGKKLRYYCSGVWSFYSTILIVAGLHFSGLFKLYTILDEFGSIMSVAIISGFLVSIVAYFSAIWRGAQHRMTGSFLYDFFMGAELNPRLFGWLDFKMFFEVRLPWFILFLLSSATAARQYDRYGYVSGEVGFILMAHFLYANACCKGEELIVTTWDMYYEKWGFMLIFWNLAGVPLSYCHCTLYLANHEPKEFRWSTWALVALYTSYLFVYWVWDTCNSQKNMFRQTERGNRIDRKTFPQLPWKEIKNPKKIETQTGDSLLCDGWCKLLAQFQSLKIVRTNFNNRRLCQKSSLRL